MDQHNGRGGTKQPYQDTRALPEAEQQVSTAIQQGNQQRKQAGVVCQAGHHIAAQQIDSGPLHAAARAVDAGQRFDRAGKQMLFEVIDPAQFWKPRFMKLNANEPTRMI